MDGFAFAAFVFDLGAFLGMGVYRVAPDCIDALVDRALRRALLLPYRGRHRALPVHPTAGHAPTDSARRVALIPTPPPARRAVPSLTDGGTRPSTVGQVYGRHAA
jgi:hypothetical protein